MGSQKIALKGNKEVFAQGDKVVYPLYGAGVIQELRRQTIDGNDHVSYVLKMPVGNMEITVSAKKAESIGVRSVTKKSELLKLIKNVKTVPMPENWNQRYKENMDVIKTGNISKVAEVFRTLRERERERGLSSAEKKMLTTLKQIILSEIILSHDLERPAAEALLEKAIY